MHLRGRRNWYEKCFINVRSDIKTGGKRYRVQQDDVIEIEKSISKTAQKILLLTKFGYVNKRRLELTVGTRLLKCSG